MYSGQISFKIQTFNSMAMNADEDRSLKTNKQTDANANAKEKKKQTNKLTLR